MHSSYDFNNSASPPQTYGMRPFIFIKWSAWNRQDVYSGAPGQKLFDYVISRTAAAAAQSELLTYPEYEPRKRQRQGRDVRSNQQNGQPSENDKEYRRLKHFIDRRLADTAGQIKQRSAGRRDIRQSEVYADYRRKVYRADADLVNDRYHNRRSQNACTAVVHKHAQDNHKNVQHEKNRVFIGRYRVKQVKDDMGDVFHNVYSAQNVAGEQHDHDGARSGYRFYDGLFEAFHRKPLIYEHTDRQSVHDGHARSLRRRHNSAVDTAQYYYRHEQRGESFSVLGSEQRELLARNDYVSSADRLRRRYNDVLVIAKKVAVEERQQRSQNDAGNDRREEAGEDGLSAGPRIKYHNRARRNQHSQDRRRSKQSGAVASRIIGFREAREHYRPDASQRSAGASGNGAEHGAGNGRDYSQTSAYSADEIFNQADDFIRDISFFHEPSGYYKQRNRKQNSRPYLIYAVRHHKAGRNVPHDDEKHCGSHERKADGHADN